MKVGVFDSGIGGLTVLKKIYKHYPQNEYIYFGDTINLPYGNKTQQQLNELSSQDVEFLLSQGVDIIIIACGTVSSNCLEYLKNKYDIPIYDIISPTINYLNNSQYNNIGVIATNATIESKIFSTNLNKKVYEIKTPELVPLIETNDETQIDIVIDKYLKDYKDKFDILVLGCTHYPIIKDKLDKYFQHQIELLDMSNQLLSKIENGNKSQITIYYSEITETIIRNTEKTLNQPNVNIRKKVKR